MRFDPPPEGKPMLFEEFGRALTDELRRLLPGVDARGSTKRIVWSYDGRTATMTEEPGHFSIVTTSAGGGLGMAPLHAGTRRDLFVARNLAKSLAGFFDPRLSTP